MKTRERLTESLKRNKLARKFLDYDFRTLVFATLSLAITSGYALFYGAFGVALPSLWYGVLAFYYLTIAVIRAIAVLYRPKKSVKNAAQADGKLAKAKIYRLCGILISLITLPLSVVILQVVAQKATFSHAGLMIYVAATYTTYKVAATIRHVIAARKSDDMTVRTVRGINLADAAVSVFALQVSMFDSFSDNADWRVFNAVTGAAVCLLTVIIGVFMAIDARRRIAEINAAQT